LFLEFHILYQKLYTICGKCQLLLMHILQDFNLLRSYIVRHGCTGAM